MKVVILGAGVIGVTSAYALARAGHEVTVLERQPGPALETSFANAGEVSPGYASPWAAPGIPAKAIKWLLMDHPPLILRPRFDPQMVAWLIRMLRNCTHHRYALNKGRMVRLAEYSRDVLIDLRARTGLQYDERSRGTLQLFRKQSQVDGAAKDVEVLKADGVPYEVLDKAGCIAAEPGLAYSRDPFVGGLRLPNDETGDCFKFTNALAKLAESEGVTFRYGVSITRLRADQGRITGVETDQGVVIADAYLLALGSYSAAMVRPLDIVLPVYPVKGYSITVPIANADRAPVSTLMDESYKIAITRLGDRIRVGGMAEISGFTNDRHPRRQRALEHSLDTLFPGVGVAGEASFWSGLRPMTPDGTPVIGRTPVQNLYFNTGHGTLGWTMATGSAQVVADIISGTPPAIDARDLSVFRYGA